MTQVDFIISIAIIIITISFVIFYMSNSFSNEINIIRSSELKESANSLEKQFFEIKSNVSLEDNVNKVQGIYKEIGGYSHMEKMKISLEPALLISKPHVYDNFMNEIPSEIKIVGGKVKIDFWLEFSPYEQRQANIFFFGGPTTKIKYMTNITETNITGFILSEEKLSIVSQKKCNNLKNITYEDIRKSLGFRHHFKIDFKCLIGLEPPETNVIINSIPILFENKNELITLEMAKVLVW